MRLSSLFLVLALCSISAYAAASDGGAAAPSARSWELAATDASVNASIGSSVAISGNTVVVGSIGGGPVYVYEKPSGGWRNVLPTAELTPSAGGFGDTVVAVSGDTIVVGSLDFFDVAVYVFVKPAGGWVNMTETAQLSDGARGDYFGGSVAIDGGTIVIGAAGTTVNGTAYQGSAYVFVEPPNGWVSTSAYKAQLTSTDGTYYDLFGSSVGISGGTIVVGAPLVDDAPGPGAAYVYVEPATGWASMTQTAELTESQQGPHDELGISVAIYGNTIVSGASEANITGGAYLFVEPASGWANMTETTQLLNPNSIPGFGADVGISGDQVIVGQRYASDNHVFVYAKPLDGWQPTAMPAVTLYNGQAQAEFATSIASSGGVVVVGAPYETIDGHSDQGVVFGFDLSRPY
jgi:hypothetical protein